MLGCRCGFLGFVLVSDEYVFGVDCLYVYEFWYYMVNKFNLLFNWIICEYRV